MILSIKYSAFSIKMEYKWTWSHNSVKDICLLVALFCNILWSGFFALIPSPIGFPHQSHFLNYLFLPLPVSSFSRMVTSIKIYSNMPKWSQGKVFFFFKLPSFFKFQVRKHYITSVNQLFIPFYRNLNLII